MGDINTSTPIPPSPPTPPPHHHHNNNSNNNNSNNNNNNNSYTHKGQTPSTSLLQTEITVN